MTKEEIILANRQHLFPGVFHYYKDPLVVSHAKDQYVWDADGNHYLDFFGAIVTISVGHCNTEVKQALELVEDRESKAPVAAQTAAVMEAARENRLLTGTGGFYGNVLRLSPPLNIAKSDVDEFLRLLDASLVRAQALAAV